MSSRSTPARLTWPSQIEAWSTALGSLIALAAALGVGRFVYTPILPPMIDALGLSKSAAGLIASANFLGYLIGALLAAWPGLAEARRNWLLTSLAVSSVTTASMGLTQSLVPFLVLRCIGGAASAVVLVLASAVMLERMVPGRRAAWWSTLHFAGVGTGIAASALLVAVLVRLGQPWQTLWIGSGVLSLGATGAVALLIRERTAPHVPSRPQARPAADPRLRRMVAAYGLFGFGYVITATFLVTIVRSTPSIQNLEPVIWIVFGLAAAPSVVIWTWISLHLGVPRAFATACVVEAAGVLASVAWPTGAGVFVAAVLVGGTFMGLTALGLVRARSLVAGDPRQVLALMTGAFGLGQIVGPVFAGVVAERLGFAVPSTAAAAALLVAALLALSRTR